MNKKICPQCDREWIEDQDACTCGWDVGYVDAEINLPTGCVHVTLIGILIWAVVIYGGVKLYKWVNEPTPVCYMTHSGETYQRDEFGHKQPCEESNE